MNTAKIAALCVFSDCQRYLKQDASAGRNPYFDYVTRCALRDDVPAGGPTYAVSIDDHVRSIRRVDEFGDRQYDLLQVDCSARVYAWALKQLPTEDDLTPAQERWSAALAIHPTKESGEEMTHTFCISGAASFATLLRGMRAYQAKRRKHARKVLAQVKEYLWQQVQAQAAAHRQQQSAAADASRATALEAVRAGSAVAAAPAAVPALSCLHLPATEYHRRVAQAEAMEEQQQQEYGQLDSQYGREIMWHPAFAAEFVTSMGNIPLREVGVWLDGYLAKDYNNGTALDLIDYSYLADVLRDSLAESSVPRAALRLSRALAWVEMEGARLLAAPTAHAFLPSPSMAVVARAEEAALKAGAAA